MAVCDASVTQRHHAAHQHSSACMQAIHQGPCPTDSLLEEYAELLLQREWHHRGPCLGSLLYHHPLHWERKTERCKIEMMASKRHTFTSLCASILDIIWWWLAGEESKEEMPQRSHYILIHNVERVTEYISIGDEAEEAYMDRVSRVMVSEDEIKHNM